MTPLSSLNKRLYHYHFRKHFRNYNLLFRAYRRMESLGFKLNKQTELNENKIGYASNWFSISNELANAVVTHETWIYNKFKNGFLVDELLFLPL